MFELSVLNIAIIVGVVLLLVLIFTSYVKAPPSTAYLISGLSKTPRILIGRGGFRIPFLERLDVVYLGQITVDIKTESPVPTMDFINVDVDAVAKIRVAPTPEGIQLAGKNFLNMTPDQIARQLQDSLQGNMREIIGTLDLKSLNTNRDGFSDQVMEKASPDMLKLGIQVISCNIQNVTDKEGLIKDLGADNTYKIKKEAQINKANAERDIAVQVSKANQESNEARVESETAIAQRNNELELKKAELKLISDIEKAKADNAYNLENQEQLKELNIRTVNAQIEKTKREQDLSKERILVRENELAAEVNRQADADKYKLEVEAQAELEQRKRKAEAEKFEIEQRAIALKTEAEAKKYEAEQEAEAIKARGMAEAQARKFEAEAEAEAIKAKGLAEAEAIAAKGKAEADAMEKKAEAYKKYTGAAIVEMMVKVMPEMASNIAMPLSSIDSVAIYGTDGSGVSSISGNVPVMMKQMFDTMTEATGVDMREVLKAHTLEAKTTHNINLNEGAEAVVEVIKEVTKK